MRPSELTDAKLRKKHCDTRSEIQALESRGLETLESANDVQLVSFMLSVNKSLYDGRMVQSNKKKTLSPVGQNRKFLICGTVRNSQFNIAKDIQRLEKSLRNFGEVNFFVVESDSTDGTVIALEQLSSTSENFAFTTLGNLEQDIPDRIERLAFCRNEYLKYLETAHGFDFLVVADLDGLNARLSSDSFSSIVWDDSWDALFANQLGPYYDLLALRHPLWCHTDPFAIKRHWIELGLSDRSAGMAAIVSRMIQIPIKSPPIRVESAFGGLGVYRVTSLSADARYNSRDMEGNPASEHVAFNQALGKKGAQLFILPSLINARFTEHTYKLNLPRTILRWAIWPMMRAFQKVGSTPLTY